MSDTVAEKFAEHVKSAAIEIRDNVSREFPNQSESAQVIFEIIGGVFMTPDLMHGFQRWMQIGKMIQSSAECDCDDHDNHAFLRRCSDIMLGHTMAWQIDTFRNLLEGFDLSPEVLDQVVEAFARKLAADLVKVEKVEVPDYVPSDWESNE